jgi:hypothetical protein
VIRTDFEELLNSLVLRLTAEARDRAFTESKQFERRAREVLKEMVSIRGIEIDACRNAQVFPDITVGEFGIEVKCTVGDSWRSVANSVFEGTRAEEVKWIYLLYGKMGGTPEVRWGRYEDCVMHVRTSHVPRFEVEIGAAQSLFEKLETTYGDFCALSIAEKMRLIRGYARSRLKPGEHLWWVDEKPEQERTFPLEVRLYMYLPQEEKRKLRAEAALLCPQIVKPSRTKRKYEDAVSYILTYHGVLCPQARDLFSAGSVALRGNPKRGGNYILRALKDIEGEMVEAARYLEDSLFVEYWGESASPERRISEWLRRADGYARDWLPSKELFLERQRI